MKFKSRIAGFLAASALAFSGSSTAFVVDFENIADTEGEAGFAAWSRTFDGIEITATGTSVGDGDANPDYFAYLDSGNAGLGVCKILTSSDQCSPSSDDNVTVGEMLTLAFDSEVTISNLFFRNGGHGTSFANDAELFISVDNGSFQNYTLVSDFNVPLSGSSFRFYGDQSNSSYGYQFYISAVTAEGASSVPSPAPIGLLGLALVGLGYSRRRSR